MKYYVTNINYYSYITSPTEILDIRRVSLYTLYEGYVSILDLILLPTHYNSSFKTALSVSLYFYNHFQKAFNVKLIYLNSQTCVKYNCMNNWF